MSEKKPEADGFIRMPLSELQTPHEGRIIYMNRWWRVTDKDEALFYKKYSSPQCNDNKSIVERFGTKVPGCKVVFVPVAYLPVEWRDYTDNVHITKPDEW